MHYLNRVLLFNLAVASSMVSTKIVAAQGSTKAGQTLVSSAPNWDARILVSEKVCGYCKLDDHIRAERLGLGLLPTASVERPPEGVFPGSGSTTDTRGYHLAIGHLTMRDVDGYLSYGECPVLPQLTADTTSKIPSESEARTMAHELAARLELPSEEFARAESHGIAIGGTTVLGAIAPTTIGRMVEFQRAVNGHRVLDSIARFQFGPNGGLKNVKVQWPEFRIRPGLKTVRERASVLADIARRVGSGAIQTMEIVYAQSADGWMTPVMLVVAAPSSTTDGKVTPIVHRALVPLAE